MTLNLLVLYVSDLERSRTFYELLGLDLRREQHGGPVHYAAELDGGTVLELYPTPPGGPVTRVRLGFDVPDRDAAFTALRRAVHGEADWAGDRPGLREAGAQGTYTASDLGL